ncbi:hypothetical protein [Kitasatospora aureofaciens]|uniref:hypothetical protein n=1 Tax=Kitasatospora aureofaciens TaxID=1894 RepID=UPI0033C16779
MNPGGTGARPGRARRALGPGATRVLADTVRAPRTPPPWSPAAVDAALRTAWKEFERRAGPSFEGLDEDVLAEAAAEARAFGTEPASAVDELVHGLLRELDHWQRAIGEFGRWLTTAAQDRPHPDFAADAGRAEDVHWRRARQA